MTTRRSILFTIDSPGGGGDRPPMIALARGLQNRGHQVTMLCDEACEKSLLSTGLSVITIPAPFAQASYFTPTTIPDWLDDFKAACGTPDHDPAVPNPLVEWAKGALPLSVEAVADIKPDLIVSSLFCMGLGDALARTLSIPWCFVNPSFYFGDPHAATWAADWYGEGTMLFMQYCFLPVSQRADMVLHATDPEFDAVGLPSNHHHIGFLLWEPPLNVPSFITEQGDPWVLITTSSVPQPDELTMARAALEALADQPMRSLLTFPNRDPKVLGATPSNATIVDYIPHTPVIQRSTLVVSHAGHGIVSKALYHGVPMVLLPWDRDQPGVASRAEKLGVADVVPRTEVTPETVRQAVETVLTNPIYREAAAKVSARLKATDSVEIGCELLERF